MTTTERNATVNRCLFEFPSESEARQYFVCNGQAALREVKKRGLLGALVRYPGANDLYIPLATLQAMSEFNPIVSLFFADTSLPAAALVAASRKLEEGGDRWGIVRLSDQRQVVMSSGMSGVLLAGVGLPETTRWRRPEFWEPQDLAEFDRTWRRSRRIEGDNPIEWQYRIKKPGTQDPWQYYRSSFRPFDADGEIFQLCEFIDRK